MYPQLQAFVEVARRGSVTRAAKALYVTQPALTARLNALERSLQAELLVRRRGGARLTEAGREFLPYAERALQAVDEGRQVLGELRRGEGEARRARRGAVHHVRPRVELPRADQRALPRIGEPSPLPDGAGQHRLREEDGRAGARRRVPAGGCGRRRGALASI